MSFPSFLTSADAADGAVVPGGVESGSASSGQYTQYAVLRECPRCFLGTGGGRSCPTCGFDLSDDNIAAEHAAKAQNLQRRGRALSYIVLAAAVFVLTASLFYAMGRRSTAVETDAQVQADHERTVAAARSIWRALDEPTRLSLKARDYMTLFRPDSVGRVVQVSFAPISISGQAPSAPTRDLSLVFSEDRPWRRLSADLHLIIIASLAEYHKAFLTDAGYPDSTHYAVQLLAPDGRGGLWILARRDRTGHLTVTPPSNSTRPTPPATQR